MKTCKCKNYEYIAKRLSSGFYTENMKERKYRRMVTTACSTT